MILHYSEATINLKMYYLCVYVCVRTHTHTPYLPVYKTNFFEDSSLLGCDTQLLGVWFLTFWMTTVPPYSAASSKISLYLLGLPHPWRWRHYIPSKGWKPFIQQQNITPHPRRPESSTTMLSQSHIPLCCHNLISHYVLPIHHLKNRRVVFYWHIELHTLCVAIFLKTEDYEGCLGCLIFK